MLKSKFVLLLLFFTSLAMAERSRQDNPRGRCLDKELATYQENLSWVRRFKKEAWKRFTFCKSLAKTNETRAKQSVSADWFEYWMGQYYKQMEACEEQKRYWDEKDTAQYETDRATYFAAAAECNSLSSKKDQ